MSEFTNEGFNIGYLTGKLSERERILELLKEEFGEDYYEMGVCGQIVRLIKGEN